MVCTSTTTESPLMKMMSSGMSVPFIQKLRDLILHIDEQHAAVAPQGLAAHEAHGALF